MVSGLDRQDCKEGPRRMFGRRGRRSGGDLQGREWHSLHSRAHGLVATATEPPSLPAAPCAIRNIDVCYRIREPLEKNNKGEGREGKRVAHDAKACDRRVAGLARTGALSCEVRGEGASVSTTSLLSTSSDARHHNPGAWIPDNLITTGSPDRRDNIFPFCKDPTRNWIRYRHPETTSPERNIGLGICDTRPLPGSPEEISVAR